MVSKLILKACEGHLNFEQNAIQTEIKRKLEMHRFFVGAVLFSELRYYVFVINCIILL